MKLRNRFAFWAALVSLGGCATPIIFEDKYAMTDGWHKGEILKIESARTISHRSAHDCRAGAGSSADDSPYAVVAYRHNGHPYSRIVKVPDGAQLEVGDRVYVNENTCDAPLPHRG